MTHENFAHIGVKKTFILLAEKYYWLNMNFDVRLCIGACKSCAEKKNAPVKNIRRRADKHVIHFKSYL